jgi:hypothetical protein
MWAGNFIKKKTTFLLSILVKMDDYLSKWMCCIGIFVELSLIGITKMIYKHSVLFSWWLWCL